MAETFSRMQLRAAQFERGKQGIFMVDQGVLKKTSEQYPKQRIHFFNRELYKSRIQYYN